MSATLLRRILGIASPFMIVIAGCGGGSTTSANPNNGTFTISPATIAVDTNCNGCSGSTGQQFKATLNSSGAAAAVNWTLSGGDANAGPGNIDATGIYTPPSYLSKDSVAVKVKATLQSSPSNSVSAVATVTPGFLQPFTPENAAVAAGSTLVINGSIAEITSGTINWALSTSSTTVTTPASGSGTLTANSCKHDSTGQNYTSCTVTYTAPATAPATIPTLYVVGTVNSNTFAQRLHILLNSNGINSSGLTNQAVQTGAISLGSSGGNNGDYDNATSSTGQTYIADCCAGTLGSLIQDNSSNLYILSNNHVLAESDQATIGDNIVQPGLIEDGCIPYGQANTTVRPVAALSHYVPINNTSTNVDAAIAKIAAGSVDPTGGILQLGALGANGVLAAAPPAGGTGEAVTATNIGMQVVKSGRTTGLTCSAINGISVNIGVDYYKDCAETTLYYSKTFTNQITISGNNFTDSGDSGSLIVDASNAQPVGLFYAGNTGISVANPIADVLTALSAQAGTGGATFSFPANPTHSVSCLNYDQNTVTAASKRTVTSEAIASAQTIANTAGAALVNYKAGILGVAAGRSVDSPGEATVIVYTSKSNVAVPATVGGLRTQVIQTTAATFASGNAPTTQNVAENITLPASVLTAAIAVKEQNWRQLMKKDSAFFGVGVTQSHDNPNEAALMVLVDQKTEKRAAASLPSTTGGLRVRYIYLDRLHVTKSKYAVSPHPSACAIKSIMKAKAGSLDGNPDSNLDADLDLNKPASLHLQ